MKAQEFLSELQRRFPNEPEYLQAVEEVDQKLQEIMRDIHEQCVKYGKTDDGYVNYVKGANTAGFLKVANAMYAQGVF